MAGYCACSQGYGCDSCRVQLLPALGTSRTYLSPPAGSVSMCGFEFGGGVCSSDYNCAEGICLGGRCVCYAGWVCPYCTLDMNADVLNHATCASYVTGGGPCAVGAAGACSANGLCAGTRCQCNTGYACADCSVLSATLLNVAAGADCACPAGMCGAHGACSARGVCVCDEGWSGVFCEFNPCAGVTCSDQGTCVPNNGTCACIPGYSGVDCSVGGGVCATSADCGVWAPTSTAECSNGYTCVNNMYGGMCIAGTCQCQSGFTCPNCDAKGYFECGLGAGGGLCSADADCGATAAGTNGGHCFSGRCVCYPGFSCPFCTVRSRAGVCARG